MNRRIAITAMSGLFPGTAGPVGVEGLWNNVRRATPARLESLEHKWGLPREEYFDPKPGAPYRTYLDAAYLISSRGASRQVELGKQVLGQLLDNATAGGGAMPEPSRIGLSVGTLWSDASYFAEDAKRVLGDGIRIHVAAESGTFGPDTQLAALAESAGIAGPKLAVDTACASSLYALDAAIAMLDQDRADAVAVMGLNGFLPPFLYLGFSKLMALTTKGHILPFSSDACGIIPSEAIAALLVEPLDQAVRCGRPVLAVIRGLGLSADGGDCSVFAPSPRGQQLAYERAYGAVGPGSIDYVEAHGTATVLGDATEIQTLNQFFAPHRGKRPLPIGSIKALIGHSIASAGISSLIKAICMLRDGVIPPHIPVQPNPRLRDTCLRLPTEAEPWPHDSGPRRIAISSFGLGGANSHLVIGSLEDADLEHMPARPMPRHVAILAFEATIAEAHGSGAVRDLLTQPSKTERDAAFPWQRFSSRLGGSGNGRTSGRFFPSSFTVDANGLRMGPKALAKLDPFQRLGIHAVQTCLQEVSGTAVASAIEDTAVVFCSNLGGEGALQLSRHYLAHFSGKLPNDDRYAQIEPSMEAIASGLSALCSGFPAFHLGLKGFHETVSGDSSTFWESLMLAPYWLDSKCASLVLAAGRHIKSPVDLDGASAPGEGIAAFLLQSESTARRSGIEPVAVIRGFENSLELACSRHGLRPADVDLVEISRLDLDVVPGSAQDVTGFLGEATGVEALLRILLANGTGWRAIEIRAGEKTLAVALIEKLREYAPRQLTPAAPIPIEFHSPAPATAPAEEPAGFSASTFLAWQTTTAETLSAYLRFQAQLATLSGTPAPAAAPSEARLRRPLHSLRANQKNIVLEAPGVNVAENGAAEASARLRVDEGHSYFFDHPLDHVPGILIMEGALQLVEMLIPAADFIRSIDLNFRRFCEKQDPALIRIRPSSQGGAAMLHSVAVIQNGFDVARAEIETAPAPPVADVVPSATARSTKPLPDPKYLHKLNRENVLVTEIEHIIAGEVCACDLLPPPAGHILSEGAPHSYSLLYVLEATRQFVMLIAHQVEKIPFGMQMNLISIRVRLSAPAPRGAPLRFVCTRQPVQRIGQMTIATISLELHADRRKIGESAIKAQVVDKETYARQRGASLVEQEL